MTRCTARRAFRRAAVCFSETRSTPAAKAHTVPRHRMLCGALVQPGLQQELSESRLKTPCEKLARLKNTVFLRRAQASSLDSTSTSMLDNERNDALIALAVLVRCRRHACWSVEVCARMVCLLTAWHDQVTLSQSWMSNEAHIQFESMTGQVVDSCR